VPESEAKGKQLTTTIIADWQKFTQRVFGGYREHRISSRHQMSRATSGRGFMKNALGHSCDRGSSISKTNHADQSRLQVPPQSQFSHVQFSQVQFSHDSPLQSHWQFSHEQLSPQQHALATLLSAETELKPSNEAPATTAEAKSLDVTDMVMISCELGSRMGKSGKESE
jgi:hypothetical protein